MEFQSVKSIKTLETALEREKLAWEAYESIAEHSHTPGVVEVAKILALEEKKHFEIISGLLKDAREKRLVQILKKGSYHPKDILSGAFKNGGLKLKEESDNIKELLKTALAKERESFNFYSKAAKESTDKEVTDIYTYLADEENKHYVMVDNIIDFTSNPEKWIYKEENMIFHL
jgi:rubrerythrin